MGPSSHTTGCVEDGPKPFSGIINSMKARRVLIWAGMLALALAIVINFGYLSTFIDLLGHVQWYVLVLVATAQVWSYYSIAKFYQAFLRIFDYNISTRRLFEASLAINFVNQAFPSGGVSGASYLSQYLKGEVPVGKATLAQFVRYVFTYISFLVVLVFGFMLLFFVGNVSSITVRLTLFVILLLIVMSLLLVTVVADRKRMEAIARPVVRLVNKIGSLVRRKRFVSDAQLSHFFDEFYEGYHFLLANRSKWRLPLICALSANIAEVSTVYIVVLAFGVTLNPGIVIAAYTLANLFSIVSIISSGVGVYELTMVAAFAALKVPLALAVSVVIVYRMLNFVIFLPIGFYLYHKELSND